MKIVIAVGLLAIVGALAAAGYFMLKSGGDADDPQRHARMARALAWRVGLSVTLFLALLAAYALGWIAPTGLPVGR